MKNEKLKLILKEFFKEAEGIWLFGSYADGTYNENSDIDIAVLFKNEKSPLEVFKLKENLEYFLKKDVDLIDIQNVNTVFQFKIVTTGKKIISSKAANEFENRIWWNYLTLQDDREILLKDKVWTKL
ncbi:type VII toxin-antitoxin system MntA family adenylyltransferase antitoxin [Caminibacter sp.]